MIVEDIETLRGRYWSLHPVIKANAVIPTRTMKDAIARVLEVSTRARASIAFYAFPEFGKSFCLRALESAVMAKFGGAGIVNLEFGDDDLAPSEGRMLETIVLAAGCGDRMAKSIAGKRDQVHRLLLARSGADKHIFLFIDEAQELTRQHFRWLKRVINHLSKAGVDVTTVLFGQQELIKAKSDLDLNGRSDLSARFMKRLIPYRGVSCDEDIRVIMKSMDACRWTVEDRELLFTEFLFPRAYVAGFRFEQLSDSVCVALAAVPKSQLKKGLPMGVIGSFLSLLCERLKERDTAGMEVDQKIVADAFIAAYRGT